MAVPPRGKAAAQLASSQGTAMRTKRGSMQSPPLHSSPAVVPANRERSLMAAVPLFATVPAEERARNRQGFPDLNPSFVQARGIAGET